MDVVNATMPTASPESVEEYPGILDNEFKVMTENFKENVKIHQDGKVTLYFADEFVGSSDIALQLVVQTSADYPKILPVITFGESKGLTNAELNGLLALLNKKASRMKCYPMLMSLSQTVIQFLFSLQLQKKKPADQVKLSRIATFCDLRDFISSICPIQFLIFPSLCRSSHLLKLR